MQHFITYTDYARISSLPSQKNDRLLLEYRKTLDKLACCWLKKLGGSKISLLMFIAARTLKYGKLAEEIPFAAFIDGGSNDENWSFCGVGLTENHVRRHLKELIDDDFVHSYYPEKTAGSRNRLYKYYEINYKKIQNLASTLKKLGGTIMSYLRMPGAEHALGSTESSEVPLPKMRAHEVSSKREHQGTLSQSSKLSKCALGAAGRGAGRSISEDRSLQSISNIQKSVGHEAATYSTTKRNAKEVTARSAAQSTGKLTIATAKRIVTDAMQMYHPRLPIPTVSAKALSKLNANANKRSIASVDEIEQIVAWSIREWDRISLSHKKALIRRMQQGASANDTQPMLRTPDFSTLAYRFAYFAVAYANDAVQIAKFGTKEDIAAGKIVKLEATLNYIKQQNIGLREIARKAAIERSAERTEAMEDGLVSGNPYCEDAVPTRVRRTVAVPARPALSDEEFQRILGEDIYLPTWEEAQAKRELTALARPLHLT